MTAKRWHATAEQHDFIVEHQSLMTRAELAVAINKKFGLSLQSSNLSAYCKNRGLKIKRLVETAEQHDFIIKYQGNITRKELAELYNAEFGTNANAKQIINYCAYHDIKTKKAKNNHKPIGSIRRHGGLWRIKVGEYDWQLLHHYKWRQKHNKPIPDGFLLVFADGDCDNLDIDNLVLLHRSASIVIYHNKKANTDSAKVNKAMMLTASLTAILRDKAKTKGQPQ